MYWTKYQKYLRDQIILRVKNRKPLLVKKKLTINKLDFDCVVFKIKDPNLYHEINKINILENEYVLCYFQKLLENISLIVRFSVIEVDQYYRVTKIYHDINNFYLKQINDNRVYWLIASGAARKLNIKLGDYFFVR